MKHTLLLLIFSAFSLSLFGQTFNMDGSDFSACSGVFYDSGGSGGDYGANENFETTICPDGSGGTHVSLFFPQPDMGAGDALCFFDGPDATAPSLGCVADFNTFGFFVIQATAPNITGCITITFNSDGNTQAAGWQAGISCVAACQQINIGLDSVGTSPLPDTLGYIDICPGEIVYLQATVDYPQNGQVYPQDNSTSTFEWDFGDGTLGFGPTVAHQFNEPGGYTIQLDVTDTQGCQNANFLSQRVRVSTYPSFDVGAYDNEICAGDTFSITSSSAGGGGIVSWDPNEGSFPVGAIKSDSLPVPDGGGTSFTSTLEFTQFNPGQTLNNINDLIGICANMEHSWVHDLEILLTCPTGQSIILHNITVPNGTGGAGATFLGIPNDPDNAAAPNAIVTPWGVIEPGIGWDYCWTPGATNGTFRDYATANNPGTLPEIEYNTFDPITDLLGCELNGEWELTVTDSWGIDNGFIFSWQINFDASLFPALEAFTPNIIFAEFLPSPSIVWNASDSMAAIPNSPGTNTYVFQVEDDFGCVYDTTVFLNVLPHTDPQCFECQPLLPIFEDTTLCIAPGQAQDTLEMDLPLDSLIPLTFTATVLTEISNFVAPPSTPLEIPLEVTGVFPNIVDSATIASICLNIDHRSVGDLAIYLEAPDGSIMELTTNNGGTGDDYTNTCFTRTSTSPIDSIPPCPIPPICPTLAPYTGEWEPEGDWTSLDGSQVNGTWTLIISDNSGADDDGVLIDWSITFNLPYVLTYDWSPATDISCIDCPDPQIYPTTTTTYTVIANDNLTCSDTQTITIVIENEIAAPTPICGATGLNSLTFDWNSVTGATSYVVNVDGAGWIPASGDSSHIVTGLTNGQFVTLEVSAANPSCGFNSDSVTCQYFACDFTSTWVSSPASCFNSTDGMGIVIPITGDAPYSYLWDANAGSQTNDTAFGLVPGVYSVVIIDANNCISNQDSVVITGPTPINLSIGFDSISCFGGNDGKAYVSASGGNTPYSYLWDASTGSQAGDTAFNLVEGNYSVTVSDNTGCSDTISIFVGQNLEMMLTLDSLPVSCFDGTNGQAWTTVTGGVGPFNYMWDSLANSQFSDTAFNLPAGNFNITVTDIKGCVSMGMIEVTQPQALATQTAGEDISCNGGSDGSASVMVAGGTMPYTYNWDQGTTNAVGDSVNGLTVGTTLITIQDSNSCVTVDSVVLLQPTAIVLDSGSVDALCFNSSDGKAWIEVTGGVMPYSYLWDVGAGAQITDTAFGLPSGTYSVTVLDDNNCSQVATVSLGAPAQIMTTTTSIDANCNGGSDGLGWVVASNGVGNFSYLWDVNAGSQTTDTAFGLASGTYFVTVQDDNGCEMTDSIIIDEPAPLVLDNTDSTWVSCFGGNDGTATAVVNGGTGIISYQWDANAGNQVTSTATALAAGSYSVTVSDANNCFLITNVTVNQPSQLTLSLDSTDVDCNGNSTGTATASPGGGTTPYTFNWSNTQNTATAISLAAGNYIVTVTDDENCIIIDSVTVIEPSIVQLSIDSIPASCNGAFDGSATVSAIGGAGGYTYLWDVNAGSQITATASGLGAGNYSVTVSDVNNCPTIASITVTAPTAIMTTTGSGLASCAGGNDGLGFVTSSGGSVPYSYLWDANAGNQNTDTAVGLSPGTYLVTVTDMNGCFAVDSATILAPVPLEILSIDSLPVSCFGTPDGGAIVSVGGGVGPYTYLWDANTGFQTNDTASNLGIGNYTVTITDLNGCTITANTNVTEPTLLTVTIDHSNILCNGDSSGMAWVNVTGGSGSHTTLWDDANAQTTDTAFSLPAGVYSVTVEDANGCIINASANITEPAALLVAVPGPWDSTACNGSFDGSMMGIMVGGVVPYSYVWQDAATQEIVNSGLMVTQGTVTSSGFGAGTFQLVVTDANGCVFGGPNFPSGEVYEPVPVTAVALLVDSSKCFESEDGVAEVIAAGGAGGFTYEWNSWPVNQYEATATGLQGGNQYIAIVTDSKGCTASDTITIDQPEELSLSANADSALCYLDNSGTVWIDSIGGGTGPYNFSVGGVSEVEGDTIGDLMPGSHVVVLTDANGCTAIDNVLIEDPNPISTQLLTKDILCFGDATGEALVQLAGGNQSFTILWSNGEEGIAVDDLTAGRYDATITDSKGCTTVTEEFEITQPDKALEALIETIETDCKDSRSGMIEIAATGGLEPFSYSLDGENYDGISLIPGLTAGDYTIYIMDDNGCLITEDATIAEPIPLEVDIDANVEAIEVGDSVLLLAVTNTNPSNVITYQWSQVGNSSINCDTCNRTFVYPNESSRFIVFATDEDGCEGMGEVSIQVIKTRNIFVATGFTPNNDQINDVFFVQGPEFVKINALRVFDRWGSLVFESVDSPINDPSYGWDGTFDGQDVQMGIYTFYTEVEFIDGQKKILSGSVNVIR